jgi:hypothetical protein
MSARSMKIPFELLLSGNPQVGKGQAFVRERSVRPQHIVQVTFLIERATQKLLVVRISVLLAPPPERVGVRRHAIVGRWQRNWALRDNIGIIIGGRRSTLLIIIAGPIVLG